jgi:hypothetical protein
MPSGNTTWQVSKYEQIERITQTLPGCQAKGPSPNLWSTQAAHRDSCMPHSTHRPGESHQSDQAQAVDQGEYSSTIYNIFSAQTLAICSSIDSSSGKNTKNSQEHQEQMNS